MTDEKRLSSEITIYRLIKAADGLACGRRYHVTHFYPLLKPCIGADGYDFFVALLARVQNEVKASGNSPLIPLENKLELLEEVSAAFAAIPEVERPDWRSIICDLGKTLAGRLYSLQPGWKRIWVHAFRRRARDKELVLAEMLLKEFWQDSIALFLTSYKDYRYYLLPDAAERVRWMADFWCRALLKEDIEAYAERARLNPPVRKPRRTHSPLDDGSPALQASPARKKSRRTPSPDAQRLARAQTLKRMVRPPAEGDDEPEPFEPLPLPVGSPPPFVLDRKTIDRLNELEATLETKEERGELDDPAEEKLARAHYNLVMAWQLFRGNDELYKVTTRLKGAKNRCCEAWLLRNGHVPSVYDNRDIMASWFYVRAPVLLLRKAQVLEQKLTELYHEYTDLDQAVAGGEASPLDRRSEIASCLAETLAFYEHFRDGKPLPFFRWERENDFSPGQWVLMLKSALAGCDEHGHPMSRWWTIPHQVTAVTDREVVLRPRHKRSLNRFFAGTLCLWPTAAKDDLSSAVDKRRIWFDLRPQLRQVPLVLPSFQGIGKSMDKAVDFSSAVYETCPCCGYPVNMSQRLYISRQQVIRQRCWSCLICDWIEKDGLDSAAQRLENFGYSLAEARENFAAFGTIFRPEDGVDFTRHRLENVRRLKGRLCAAFDAMIEERNHGLIFLLWWEAEGLRRELIDLYACMDGIEADDIDEPSSIEPGVWIDDSIDHDSLVIAVYFEGHGSAVLRIRNRKGENRPISAEYGRKILPRPRIDIWKPFFARRTWFECYSEFLCGKQPCPCCGYPTLSKRGVSESCPLCQWRDDGQDDYDADQVHGGLNGGYSLTRARKNFEETLTMFPHDETGADPGDIPGSFNWDLKKKRLLSLYDRLISAEDADAAERLWSEIDECWRDNTGP